MGVDVLLYAEVTPTPDEFVHAEETFNRRCSVADRYEHEGKIYWLSLTLEERTEWSPPRVSANITQRYYGKGYERGDWPSIYGAIRLLQSLFPAAQVFYGGDTDVVAPEATEQSLAEAWEHFLGPHGDDYRAARR